MKILLFFITLLTVGHSYPQLEKKFFNESNIPFDNKPLSGRQFYVMKHRGMNKYNEQIEKLKAGASQYFSRNGFKIVDNSVDANLLVLTGYYELDHLYNGKNFKVGHFYIAGVGQSFGNVATKKFDSLSSFYIDHKPSDKEINNTIDIIVNNLKHTKLTVDDHKDVEKRPGCYPIFGFKTETRDEKVFVEEVIKDEAFEKAGIKKGDIVLEMNSKPYSKFISGINGQEYYNGAKAVKFLFERDGKKIEKSIKPQISCKEWPVYEEAK